MKSRGDCAWKFELTDCLYWRPRSVSLLCQPHSSENGASLRPPTFVAFILCLSHFSLFQLHVTLLSNLVMHSGCSILAFIIDNNMLEKIHIFPIHNKFCGTLKRKSIFLCNLRNDYNSFVKGKSTSNMSLRTYQKFPIQLAFPLCWSKRLK